MRWPRVVSETNSRRIVVSGSTFIRPAFCCYSNGDRLPFSFCSTHARLTAVFTSIPIRLKSGRFSDEWRTNGPQAGRPHSSEKWSFFRRMEDQRSLRAGRLQFVSKNNNNSRIINNKTEVECSSLVRPCRRRASNHRSSASHTGARTRLAERVSWGPQWLHACCLVQERGLGVLSSSAEATCPLTPYSFYFRRSGLSN